MAACAGQRIIAALGALGETESLPLAQSADAIAPAGEDFVRIGLMADIPDHNILRLKHIMQRHGELDHKAGAQVAAGLATALMVSARTSSANWRSWLSGSARRSAGASQCRAAGLRAMEPLSNGCVSMEARPMLANIDAGGRLRLKNLAFSCGKAAHHKIAGAARSYRKLGMAAAVRTGKILGPARGAMRGF